MRKVFLISISLCLVLVCVTPVVFAEELMISGFTDAHDAYELFTSENPDVPVTAELSCYNSDTQLINAFLSGEFLYDVFCMDTGSFNIEQLFAKGYCADLSGSEVIRKAVSEMHPSIQKLITSDGAIYGLPLSNYISFICYDADAWEEAGLSDEDVPDSFPMLLDFLEKWLDRIEDDPDNEIGMYGLFDEDLYNEASYVNLLTTWLINEHIMQTCYTNEPLRFDSSDFVALLQRCQDIGRKLYELDPAPKCRLALFKSSSFVTDMEHMVSFRLNEQQPKPMKANLNLVLIYAGSKHLESALSFLEDCLSVMPESNYALLCQQASAIEDKSYESNVAFWQEQVDRAKEQLDAASDADRRDAEDELKRLETILATVSSPENRYQITTEQLALYESYGDSMFFQPPSVFASNTEEGQNVRALIGQFSFGQLPAEMLIKRLNELAMMLENERQ